MLTWYGTSTRAASSRSSGNLELLVAEVGDELEGAAEGDDEAVQDVLGGDVTVTSSAKTAMTKSAYSGGRCLPAADASS